MVEKDASSVAARPAAPEPGPAAALAGPGRTDRAAMAAAGVLSLALLGDALLYVVLPMHHAAFGVTLAEAGVLLAANRIVRIFGYGAIARALGRHGPRRFCGLGVLTAAASTLAYALLDGFWPQVGARVLWGLTFAGLSLAMQELAVREAAGAARRSGLTRAVAGIGPIFTLTVGAGMVPVLGPQGVFAALAALTLGGLAFRAGLPPGPGAPPPLAGRGLRLPSRLEVWVVLYGLCADGAFGVSLPLLFAAPHGQSWLPPELAAGSLLAARYVVEFAAPYSGRLADHIGVGRLLLVLSLAAASGLALMGAGLPALGAAIVILARGLAMPLPPPLAARRAEPGDQLGALSRIAIWRDIGAAIGPMLVATALPAVGAGPLHLGLGATVAAATLLDARRFWANR